MTPIVFTALFFGGRGPLVIDADLLQMTTLVVGLVTGFVMLLALPGFLIAAFHAERRRIVTVRWYLGAGAAAGLLGVVLYFSITFYRGGSISDMSGPVLLLTLTSLSGLSLVAGLVAGWIYWLIAGRRTT